MKKLATNKDRRENIKKKKERLTSISDQEKLWEFYNTFLDQKEQAEFDPKWAKNNLEYDLRASEYIVEKCKDEYYAQNVYAALCNNYFRKNEVIHILKEDSWSCSWRYAGGIVADLRGEGDYLDWYCSGIRDKEATETPDTNRYNVGEGFVTDEVKEDLFNLGWIVVDQSEEMF
jgi:hypothetical protein